MGKYINPKNQSKEDFLKQNGKLIYKQEMLEYKFSDDKLLCAWVNNGMFTAALICYCENELDYIKRSSKTDTRETHYFIVDKKKLEEFLI